VGSSPRHLALLETLAKVAPTDAEVLISGPSGVGKELYARYVHERSRRSEQPFVAINCGALPADLLENELFGHIGGAFTGATAQHAGLVASAEGGTLFLDEVDTLAHANQIKLLRFIQEREYRRLGESRVRRADVRFVAATNANLQDAVLEGRFRTDLFFRLRVVPIEVPSLRERRDDVPVLVDEYVGRYAEVYRVPRVQFSAAAAAALQEYSWPGTIRELENCVRYLTCLQLGRAVEVADLALLSARQGEARPEPAEPRPDARAGGFRAAKRRLVDSFEREFLVEALREANGNVARAAAQSGKNRRAFFELMRKHDIDAADFRRVGATGQA
jgi:DNA-binding NtrC family response regulator